MEVPLPMPSRRLIAFALLVFAIVWAGARPAAAQTYTVARGLAYEKAKDWQGLLKYATAWSEAQPNSIDAWAFVGSAYSLGLNEPDKAIAPLRRCVAIDPNSAPAWHALGTAYTQTKQLGPAVDAFKRAIQLNPNQPTYYNNLAAAYSEGNAVKSAMAALDQEKVLAERLNNANVWYTLGNGYAQLTDLNNAIVSYRRLLAIEPDFAQGWTNLGVVLQYKGDTAGARAAYRRGSQLGDPLASKDAAQMEADLRAQAQQQAQSANNGMRANAVAGMLYRMNH
jgi:tetratricopeptide (TPR) repeat protein